MLSTIRASELFLWYIDLTFIILSTKYAFYVEWHIEEISCENADAWNQDCIPIELKSVNPIAKILTSNSVGTQLSFLGCNQDNNPGSNFITKKKICLVLPEKETSNHRI